MLIEWAKLNKRLKELKGIEKGKITKTKILKNLNLLNSKLEKIKENQEELLGENNLTKEWNSLEKKRLEKQNQFNKQIGELRVPIMREIGEWQIKKDQILSGKEEGSVIECDYKIRELYKKYDENWKNVLGPLNQEAYKFAAMQRILLRKKGLIEKWDSFEDKKRTIEDKKRKIDLEIFKIEQRLKELKKNPKVKRWIKLNEKKFLYTTFDERFKVSQIGVYSLGGLVRLFRLWDDNVSKRPYYANWRLVGVCNSRCIMCDQWRKKEYSKQKFEMNDVNRILKELKRMGFYCVCFNGGEPSLLKELPAMVKKAKDLGFFTEIKTNASNLTEKYITKLHEAGLDVVHISLDGHDVKTHDSIRRIPVWAKAVKAIELIKENTEMWVRLNTLILKNNYRQLDKMIDLAKKLNADSINFSQVDDLPFKNNKDVRLNLKEMRYFYFKVAPKILEKSLNSDLKVNFTPFFSSLVGKSERLAIKQLKRKDKELQEELKNFVYGNFGESFYTKYSCYTPLRNMEIMPDGNIYPCCTTMNIEQFKMGNVHDQSLKEIWNSKKFKEFRRNVMDSREEICKKCQLDFRINKEINNVLK